MVFNHPNGKNGQNNSGSKAPEQRQPSKACASEANLSDPDFYEITEANGTENGSRSY